MPYGGVQSNTEAGQAPCFRPKGNLQICIEVILQTDGYTHKLNDKTAENNAVYSMD